MADGLTIKRLEELEHPYPKWWLVRRSLGIASFGVNLVELQPGEAIPEHDEVARDQEELFFTLAGTPTLVVEGEAHELPEGSFARLDPAPRGAQRRRGRRPPADRLRAANQRVRAARLGVAARAAAAARGMRSAHAAKSVRQDHM